MKHEPIAQHEQAHETKPTPSRHEATAAELAAFAYRLLDVDDLGLFCSDDVKDEARRLLGMPRVSGNAVNRDPVVGRRGG